MAVIKVFLTIVGALLVLFVIAAIVIPMFARPSHHYENWVCGSNERQIALGFLQYVQDYDNTFPCGVVGGNRGLGWGSQIYGYTKVPLVYMCPESTTGWPAPGHYDVTYGYNANAAGIKTNYLLQPSCNNPSL